MSAQVRRSASHSAPKEPERYLTVTRAAELLSVHPSTIRRWIDDGRLPAYRLGPKRIGIMAADLDALVTPRSRRAGVESHMDDEERITIRPLSDREQQQMFAAVEAARRHQEELLAKRGGRLFPDSTELIRRSREERTRDLMHATDE
jgi:excisionase family DNA binding protein